MKIIYTFIALTVISSFVMANPTAQSKQPKTNKPEDDVKREVSRWLHAIVERDTKTLNDLLAEEVIIVDTSGKSHGKNKELALRQTSVHNTSHNNTVDKVRVYGGVAIVTGIHTIRFQPPTQPVYWLEYRYIWTWLKKKGDWQIISQQFTRVSEE